MSRYVVAGNPVEHSQSPFIHAQFALQTGQEGMRYERLLCPLEGFPGAIRAFAAGADGQGPGRGCNVTVPFKFDAFALAGRRTARAALAQAANTLRFDSEEEAGWLADNTDGIGLVRDIQDNAGVALAGRRVLMVGAGGAAAGALGALLAARPQALVLVNRSADKAHALARSHQAWAEEHGAALISQGLADCGEAFDVVVNASSSSLQGGAIPVDARVLRPGTLALDMMYGPAAQGFMDWARGHGALPRDGLGMLVEQAAEAFSLWRGVQPDTAPVLAALRARLSHG